jgi:hypothetical protein
MQLLKECNRLEIVDQTYIFAFKIHFNNNF